MDEGGPGLELWYFADPMCSWCWGFSPVITALAEHYGDRVKIRLILGGLAPGTRGTLDDELKAEIRSHWDHVHEASGQPFDYSFFDREGFEYDTEPASRAIVAARRLDPAAALPFLARLHRGFYAEGKDVTDREVLADLAVAHGFDRDAFLDALDSQVTKQDTLADFAISRHLGVRGFPTLVGKNGNDLIALTIGYRPLDHMDPLVDAWLEEQTAA